MVYTPDGSGQKLLSHHVIQDTWIRLRPVTDLPILLVCFQRGNTLPYMYILVVLQIFNLCVVVRTRSSYCLDLVVRCNAVCLIVFFLLTVFLIIFAYCPPSPPFPRISEQ